MTSFVYVVSYRHLLATLQTASITGETYKTIQLWLKFFIACLKFSYDPPLYVCQEINGLQKTSVHALAGTDTLYTHHFPASQLVL